MRDMKLIFKYKTGFSQFLKRCSEDPLNTEILRKATLWILFDTKNTAGELSLDNFFIVAPWILIYVEFTHQKVYFY